MRGGGSEKEKANRGRDGGKHTVRAVLEVRDGQGDPPRGGTIFGVRDEAASGWVLHDYCRPFFLGYVPPGRFLLFTPFHIRASNTSATEFS